MLTHEVGKSPKGQSGFTLIELLIVIAIIAILAAIAIPMFMKYKQGAYLDSVRADVKNTVTAIESYQSTNGKYPPLTATLGVGPKVYSLADDTVATSNSNSDVAISTGNTITIAPDSTCGGYTVSGMNSNIKSGPGSEATGTNSVSYDSCTGAYTGF